ncbi:hypothetical protein FEP41_05400 [Burkholderia multivorans]|nr:hypothetical protein [Burkholderia multivorans]
MIDRQPQRGAGRAGRGIGHLPQRVGLGRAHLPQQPVPTRGRQQIATPGNRRARRGRRVAVVRRQHDGRACRRAAPVDEGGLEHRAAADRRAARVHAPAVVRGTAGDVGIDVHVAECVERVGQRIEPNRHVVDPVQRDGLAVGRRDPVSRDARMLEQQRGRRGRAAVVAERARVRRADRPIVRREARERPEAPRLARMKRARRELVQVRQAVDRPESAQLHRRHRAADRAHVHRFPAAAIREFLEPVAHAVVDAHRAHVAPRDHEMRDHPDAVPGRPYERLHDAAVRIVPRPQTEPRERLVGGRVVGLARHSAPAARQRADVEKARHVRAIAHGRIQVHEAAYLHAHGAEKFVRLLGRQPYRLIDARVMDHRAQPRAERIAERAHGRRIRHVADAVLQRHAERGGRCQRRMHVAAPFELPQPLPDHLRRIAARRLPQLLEPVAPEPRLVEREPRLVAGRQRLAARHDDRAAAPLRERAGGQQTDPARAAGEQHDVARSPVGRRIGRQRIVRGRQRVAAPALMTDFESSAAIELARDQRMHTPGFVRRDVEHAHVAVRQLLRQRFREPRPQTAERLHGRRVAVAHAAVHPCDREIEQPRRRFLARPVVVARVQ